MDAPYYANQAQYNEAATNIFAVDSQMQVLYQRNLDWMQAKLHPVIVAVFNDHGGQLTLYREPEHFETISPTPILFKKLKSISHIALAVYKLVSPYLKDPTGNDLWREPMTNYRDMVAAARATIDKADIPDDLLDNNKALCEHAIGFMDDALAKGFTVQDLLDYGAGVRPLIAKNVMAAATLQVDALLGVLTRWRDELGEEEWQNLYAVACTTWAMARENVFFQIFSKVMGKEEEHKRIILGQGINTNEEALALLARVIVDRGASEVILGNEWTLDIALMGPDAHEVLQHAPGCPHFSDLRANTA